MATNVRYPPNAQYFDLPLVGDDLQKIGRVIDLYAAPCQPVAEIWVLAFFQAIPTLLISVAKPELIDIDIKHRRGKPRKGRRMRFLASAVFRDQLITIPVPRWVVFRIYEWTQRIGWYFLIADATEQFAINWMSLAYMYNGCQVPNMVYAIGANNHLLTGSVSAPWPRTIITAAQTSNLVNFPSGLWAPSVPGLYRFTYDISFEPYQIPSQSQEPFATCVLVDGKPYQETEVVVGSGGKKRSNGSMIIDTNANPNPRIAIGGYWSTANRFCYRTTNAALNRVSDLDLSADP